MTAPACDQASALDCDVVIVGAGPVGLTVAILLAQHGHRVIVLERWPAPYPLPRAVHFDHETGRILPSCGIGPDLREISEPAEVYEWRNAAGVIHPGDPRAGRLFVQDSIDGRPFDDVHGAGWRLITSGVETRAINPAARTWFESIGGQIIPLSSPDVTYRRWFAEHGTACALQRPDFRLYGAAASASALLDHLRQRLAAGSEDQA